MNCARQGLVDIPLIMSCYKWELEAILEGLALKNVDVNIFNKIQENYRTQLKRADVASARHHASQLARHLVQLETRLVSSTNSHR